MGSALSNPEEDPERMANRLKKSLTLLRAPANSLAFALRRGLQWQRGSPELHDEDKSDLFDYLSKEGDSRDECEARHGELLAAYDLSSLRAGSSRVDYRDNLYLLDVLETLFADQPQFESKAIRVVDVGSKNWNYVFALERFWRHWNGQQGRRVSMLGVEIDGYGVYRDLHSRFDHAKAYVEQTGNGAVQYRVQDLLRCEESGIDVVTMFYPFLTRYSLLQWGLPLACFRPREMIAEALGMLGDGGSLVVFNQTRVERDILRRIVADCGATIVTSVSIRSRLVHYYERTQDRWASLVRPRAVAQRKTIAAQSVMVGV